MSMGSDLAEAGDRVDAADGHLGTGHPEIGITNSCQDAENQHGKRKNVVRHIGGL